MSGEIENRMVADRHCRSYAVVSDGTEEKEWKLRRAGYYHPDERIFVPEEDAFGFAMERCLRGTEEEQGEFKDMLLEWFYSGRGWIREK